MSNSSKVSLKSFLAVATFSLCFSAGANAAGMFKVKGTTLTQQQSIMACALGPIGGEVEECDPSDGGDPNRPTPILGGSGSTVINPMGTDGACEQQDTGIDTLVEQCKAYVFSKM